LKARRKKHALTDYILMEKAAFFVLNIISFFSSALNIDEALNMLHASRPVF
jgi:hypothetical protein